MTIGILVCGEIRASLQAQFGSYTEMVQAMLAERRTAVFDVQAGKLPASAKDCAAYVVTGSNAGVYDDLPWIPQLMDFLRSARGEAKLVGICFGHQAIAQALGGQVVKSPNGWGLGLQRYSLASRTPWMDHTGPVAIPASHQDQVASPPDDADLIAYTHSPHTRRSITAMPFPSSSIPNSRQSLRPR
jgi:GMP synthase-like glutamine amidotransferase